MTKSLITRQNQLLFHKDRIRKGIMFIPFNKILSKSSDASTNNFGTFGLLKQTLGKQNTKSLNRL